MVGGSLLQSTGTPEAGEAEVAFERLEYGKLCTSHDGPIEPGVESYPLATSPGGAPRKRHLARELPRSSARSIRSSSASEPTWWPSRG